jgi:hypothetical protein
MFCTTRRVSVVLDTPIELQYPATDLGGVLGIIAFQ